MQEKNELPNRYWFDTEFIEDGKTIDLLSIGIVAADGREYYAESAEADHDRADEWVRTNVISHLRGGNWEKPRAQIAAEIVAFVGEKPEFWAYYADYDWVALCQLYGRMIDLPKGWPMFCRDLKQWCVDLGNPKLPEQTSTEHHALADAHWNREAWDFLARRPPLEAPVDGVREAALEEAARAVLLCSPAAMGDPGSYRRGEFVGIQGAVATIRALSSPPAREAPAAGKSPITHRCDGRISPDGGYCEEENKIACPAFRRADGTVEGSAQCGEPCSWIMGKAGHGNPPWQTNADGTRRDPGEPDAPTPSSPRVQVMPKALEWLDWPNGDGSCRAVTEWNVYFITKSGADWTVNRDRNGYGSYPSLDAAKAACFNDHRDKLLSSLVITDAEGWEPIETAPKDGTYVLGYGAHKTRGYYIDAIHYYSQRWTIEWMDDYGTPTHWRPLPAPPAENGGR